MGCGPSSTAKAKSTNEMTNSEAKDNKTNAKYHAAAADDSQQSAAAAAREAAPANCDPGVETKASNDNSAGRMAHRFTSARRGLVRVLSRPMGNIRKKYQLGQEVGRGQFGVTRECVENATGKMFACKSIAKTKLMQREDIDDCRREVEVMLHLSGHPNIVRLIDVVEDATHVHLVQEMCRGGELFDRIVERSSESNSPYTEFEAAAIVRTLLQALHHCHSLGVFHRDLKPENFLLAEPNDEHTLKITDFGLSVFYKEGQNFTDIVGSSFYVAPEVLNKCYGPKSDLWSLGVILYILLCGQPPFWGETEEAIFRSVMRGQYDLVSRPWPQISSGAKNVVRLLLNSNPNSRPSAEKMLQHPWVAVGGTASKAPLASLVVDRLRKFASANKFKKQALKLIAQSLSKTEIEGLRHMFERIDTDNSGTITIDELANGLKGLGSDLADSAVRTIMQEMDEDSSGSIDYDEFITATINLNMLDREEKMREAFKRFDTDNSGTITLDELLAGLSGQGVSEKEATEILREVDTDNSGEIDYEEFCVMMRSQMRTTRARENFGQ